MQTYHVRLESPVATSFMARRAADALDIDASEKSVHELHVAADLDAPYAVGLIVGASGSGKTTLARAIFGDEALGAVLDLARPVVDQFPDAWSYDERAAALSGVGLTSVPCWIRPAHTLSNGQRARAEAAVQMARTATGGVVVLDEWTSVVDRTVAKVMSHCVQKHARRVGARVVCVSCHYDVRDWLNPDWVIDCNRATYDDRRSVQSGFRRAESLTFAVRPCDRNLWGMFARYHYLSSEPARGEVYAYGLYHGDDPVGFTAWANLVPRRVGHPVIFHGSRLVVHPDYAGFGLGRHLTNVTAGDVAARGYRVMIKFTSAPVYRALSRDPNWRLVRVERHIGRRAHGPKMQRGQASVRTNVRTVTVEWQGRGALGVVP